MAYCVRVTDPEGNDMYLRHGAKPGEGPIVQYHTREAAKKEIEFMQMGMEKGEDYESMDIVPFSKNLPEVDEVA